MLLKTLSIVSFLSAPALAAWQLQNPDQLEKALYEAFPTMQRPSNECAAFTSIERLFCKMNPADSQDAECLIEVSATAGPQKLSSKDLRLVQALRNSEINFKNQAELLELNCSRLTRHETECPKNEEKVECFIKTWGGN